jgi:hypothetical protein
MGQCCDAHSSLMGEEFVTSVIKEDSFKLKNYSYNRLLNEIVSKRIQQEIHKKHIQDLLIPQFYDKGGNNKMSEYHKSIFDYILTQLKDKNNMYTVIMYFYPFINHEGEKIEDNMYSIFHYIAGILHVSDLEEWLRHYLIFCTKGVTFAIWQKCDDTSIANALEELNVNVFNEENMKRIAEKIAFEVKKNMTPTEKKGEIKQEHFKHIFMKFDISSIENIRQMVLTGDI